MGKVMDDRQAHALLVSSQMHPQFKASAAQPAQQPPELSPEHESWSATVSRLEPLEEGEAARRCSFAPGAATDVVPTESSKPDHPS